MKKLFYMALCFASYQAKATDTLIIGQKMPALKFHRITNFPRQEMSTRDFEGKWLILDFWSRGCAACIAGFPHMDEMRKQFSGRAEFLLVGRQDPDHLIDSLYLQARKMKNLDLPSVFDSTVFEQLSINSVPQLLIIDDKGILRGWTNRIFSQELEDLIAGRRNHLTKSVATALDQTHPYLLNGNGGLDDAFEFRSILAKWKPTDPFFSPGTVRIVEYFNGLFQGIGVPLTGLYNLAYFGYDVYYGSHDPNYGKVYLHPLLLMKDTSAFLGSMRTTEGRWSYSVSLPKDKATTAEAQRVMRNDLNSFFNYKAEIETRDCPYLALVANQLAHAKLPSKGGPSHMEGEYKGKFTLHNASPSELANIMVSFDREIVIDETGLPNIDITMDELLTDPSSVMNALHSNGLDLVWKKKPMKVIVIKDSSY